MAKKDHASATKDSQMTVAATKPKREVVKSENFFSVYANDVQVQTTPWDVRLALGQVEIEGTAAAPTMRISVLGEIRLSPQLAKRLIKIVASQLKSYEETVGQIPEPKD